MCLKVVNITASQYKRNKAKYTKLQSAHRIVHYEHIYYIQYIYKTEKRHTFSTLGSFDHGHKMLHNCAGTIFVGHII